MRVLYGPVDSWRFGRSLGVDPLATRTKRCPFSCIYCQYGETPRPGVRRRTFVPVERLRAEAASLEAVDVDCVTFAGKGEPALAANLPELVEAIRGTYPGPVLVLTGSGLMPREDVRRDLLPFDAVVAKLDAPDEALFRKVNRPGRGFPYPLAAIVEGIRRFREMYTGQLILQVMFVQSNKRAASQMAALARSLGADEIQLNTPLQPALGGPLSAAEMRQVEEAFLGLPVCSVYQDGKARIRPHSF
jgi:wyosine [tRNA(Phe)-imidazoG37] synthetase (radical SAM superfamily)